MKYESKMYNTKCVKCDRKHAQCHKHCLVYRISCQSIRRQQASR